MCVTSALVKASQRPKSEVPFHRDLKDSQRRQHRQRSQSGQQVCEKRTAGKKDQRQKRCQIAASSLAIMESNMHMKVSRRNFHMPKRFWKSLRSRIFLLAVLTFIFLAVSAISFFAFLRSSHTASLSSGERQLVTLAWTIARSYSERPANMPSLASVNLPPPPPPSRSAPDAPGLTPPPPPPPPRSGPEDRLKAFTAQALRHQVGIEGGFFAARSAVLIGYAFPTHEGPGPSKEMPQRERPTIESLARGAVATNAARTSRFEGLHDAILFVAVPVNETPPGGKPEVTGAIWLMQRLPGVSGGRNRQLLWSSLGFSGAALLAALLTFFVTGEVRNGVNDVLDRLRALEGGLFTECAPLTPNSHLEEFNRVLRGIDTLASALRDKIRNERSFEAEMRHKERLSALGQFAAGIAHELRNPLATIRLRTQMSERNPGAEVVTRNSRVILQEVDRLDTIIDRLLYFARPLHLDLTQVSADELCFAAAAGWKERQGSGGVEVSCGPQSGATILCDRSRMLQVLDNLLENAVQSAAVRAGGSVSIRARRENGLTRIQVRDNGPGLGAEALRHAFDPFFTTKETGTGLGLSISFEIIQAHYGELGLSNHPEGGAVAMISLPSTPSELLNGELATGNEARFG